MTTRGELRGSLRNLLTDKTQWRDTLLNNWIEDAIRDYSHNFPRLQLVTIPMVAATKSYSLASYTVFSISQVEYPTGQTPKRRLTQLRNTDYAFEGGPYYDVKSDYSVLYIGESPALGEFLNLDFQSIHAIPTSDATLVTIPPQHFELLRLYVVWKAVLQLEMDENVAIGRKEEIMNVLGLNAYRAQRAYRDRLRDIARTYAQGGIAGAWAQDKRDRIY